VTLGLTQLLTVLPGEGEGGLADQRVSSQANRQVGNAVMVETLCYKPERRRARPVREADITAICERIV
jgi:hypothetical protein